MTLPTPYHLLDHFLQSWSRIHTEFAEVKPEISFQRNPVQQNYIMSDSSKMKHHLHLTKKLHQAVTAKHRAKSKL